MNESQDALSPLDILILTLKQWRIIGVLMLLGLFLTFGIYRVVPKYFEASTLIMPPQQQQSATSNALAQLGALGGLTSQGGAAKTPEEIYAALLRTKRIQGAVVRDLNLEAHYQEETHEAAVLRLASMVNVSTDKKSGLITILAADRQAEKSSAIANAYVLQLRMLLSKIAITEVQQRKKYLEEQLILAVKGYDTYEAEFFQKQESRGMVTGQALAESKIKAAAELRRIILEKEVSLAAISRFSTPKNVQRQGAEATLAVLKDRLEKLEQGDEGSVKSTEMRGTEASKLFRTMKAQELSIDGLLRQLQVARLDEVRDAPLIQQIDAAEPPSRVSRPNRLVFFGVGFGFSMLLSFVVAGAVGVRGYSVTENKN